MRSYLPFCVNKWHTQMSSSNEIVTNLKDEGRDTQGSLKTFTFSPLPILQLSCFQSSVFPQYKLCHRQEKPILISTAKNSVVGKYLDFNILLARELGNWMSIQYALANKALLKMTKFLKPITLYFLGVYNYSLDSQWIFLAPLDASHHQEKIILWSLWQMNKGTLKTFMV